MSNQKFVLPDGSEVGTGNIKPETLSNSLYKTFDSEFDYLDENAVKQLLSENGSHRYLKLREVRKSTMINQGNIGKCNASAAVAAMYQIRECNGYDHVPLADNYLYWNINGGQDRGSLLNDGMEFSRDNGIAPRNLVTEAGQEIGEIPQQSFNSRAIQPQIVQEADLQARRFKMWEPFVVPADWENFRQTVMTAVALDYPVVMAWDVTERSMRLNNGYIVSGRGMGNHASLFHSAKWVGGHDGVHPDLRNSWGPTKSRVYGPASQGWGDEGFGLMTMEQAHHCRQWHEFYVLTGCSGDSWNSII